MAPAEFRHPVLGLLTFDAETAWWTGEAHRNGRRIPFYVHGSSDAPNTVLVNSLLGVVENFPQVENSATEFLCDLDALVTKSDFAFQSVDFLWPHTPHNYTLTFTLEGDADAIWRVEFVSGKPKFSGRDD